MCVGGGVGWGGGEASHGLLTVTWFTGYFWRSALSATAFSAWMGRDNLWTGPDPVSYCGPGAVWRFFRLRRGRVQ